MSAERPAGAAGFLARYEGLSRRLPGARLPWVAAMRERAAEVLRARGLPTRRDEAWRYTDLRALAAAGVEEALTEVAGDPGLPPALAPARAVLIDGRLRPDLSALDGLPGTVGGVASLLDGLEGRLGALAPEGDPLVALNALLFEDGVVIDLPEGADGGAIELYAHMHRSDRPTAAHLRHVIRLGRGARLTLLEIVAGDAEARGLHNPVFEIALAEGATLTHVRVQNEPRGAFHLSAIHARLAAGATFDSFVLNAGGRLVRNELHVRLAGPRGTVHLNGAQLVADGQHADTTTVLHHDAPDCASRQTWKTVLAGRSRGVFQGRIDVARAAQRTDGYQMNQALLLSDHAEMDSKPQLEIFADDVKCSHGATVGELDAQQLFYLRARGIPAEQARAMLVEAFLAEAVEGVADPLGRRALDAALAGWWAREGVAA